MRIGFTYDLRDDYLQMGLDEEATAEFDSIYTIESITKTLEDLGHSVERIGNIWNLTKLLVLGNKWDLVFNIAEGLHGLAREAQIPALLDAYNQPYTFSAPDVIVVCHDKSLAKLQLHKEGLATAQWHVVRKVEDVQNIAMPFPLFAKPLAEGTGKGVSAKSVLYNMDDARKICADLLERFSQPVLIEKYLSGREFTIGILGTGEDAEVVAVMEIESLHSAEFGGHTYENKEDWQNRMKYSLATDQVAIQAATLALESWKVLQCRDAGRIDIRCDENQVPHFLEVNPLAGLHATHSDFPMLARMVGIEFPELIQKIVTHAQKRI